MRLTFLAPYGGTAAPTVRQLLVAAAPWLLIAVIALYALSA